MSSNKDVMGHICAGLKRHLDYGGGCKPNIDEQGSIRGCDDINYVRIRFCPWCGTELLSEEAFAAMCAQADENYGDWWDVSNPKQDGERSER